MIIKKHSYYIVLLLGFCMAAISLNAQTVEIRTDKNQILIGERITYELFVNLPAEGYSIHFDLPDSVPHFETIEKGNFDTTSSNGSMSIQQKIIFTSFDSGAWYIPSLPVTLEKSNDSKRFITDSVLINVGYAPTDSTNELRDIKPIMEVNMPNYFWYYVAGAVLLGLVIAIALYAYINRKPKPVPVLHSALSPFDEAMNDLKTLAKYDLHLPDDVKQYHTQLSFVLKRYYSRLIGQNLLNKTTDGFLLKLKEQQQEPAIISSVAEALRVGDAVKFAKYIPPAAESGNCMLKVKEAIEKLEKTKPNKN